MPTFIHPFPVLSTDTLYEADVLPTFIIQNLPGGFVVSALPLDVS